MAEHLKRYVVGSNGRYIYRIKNDYKVSVRTLGKYRKKYLSKARYDLYMNTYLSNTIEDIWRLLFYMIDLFSSLGKYLSDKCSFICPKKMSST